MFSNEKLILESKQFITDYGLNGRTLIPFVSNIVGGGVGVVGMEASAQTLLLSNTTMSTLKISLSCVTGCQHLTSTFMASKMIGKIILMLSNIYLIFVTVEKFY